MFVCQTWTDVKQDFEHVIALAAVRFNSGWSNKSIGD